MLGGFYYQTFAKDWHFGGHTLGRKIKSIESSRNMELTHNVD